MTSSLTTASEEDRLDVAIIYERHHEKLWRTLHRLGIPASDLPDAMQEVLLVVHRRLGTYDGQCQLTTWLYGICLRVAANHRRRLQRRREAPLDTTDRSGAPADLATPEQLTAERRARQRLRQVLDQLDPEKRMTFVMFELEGASCNAIAETMGVPVGTVFSRLHAARRAFREALDRLDAVPPQARRRRSRRLGL